MVKSVSMSAISTAPFDIMLKLTAMGALNFVTIAPTSAPRNFPTLFRKSTPTMMTTGRVVNEKLKYIPIPAKNIGTKSP